MCQICAECKLFCLYEESGTIVLEFQGKTQHFVVSDYGVLLELGQYVKGRDVVVTGIAPCEAYCAVGYYLVLYGSRSITYRDDSSAISSFTLWGGSIESGALHEERKWLSFQKGDIYDKAEMLHSPTGSRWEISDLLPLEVTQGFAGSSQKPLEITGEGRMAQYAVLGIQAALGGRSVIWVNKPTSDKLYYFSLEQCCEIERFSPRKSGLVIGILGDPNSGKSVFSYSLLSFLHCYLPSEIRVWRWDCDLAAPTPEWYLKAMGTDNDLLKKIDEHSRKEMKQKWSAELEKRVVETLSSLRGNLDIVLADMPGGRHPKDGEDFAPQRIPSPSRGEMLGACDAYVVISRKDKPEVFEAWRQALKQYGLEGRIIANFVSAQYACPFSMSPAVLGEDGIFHGELNGLNRENNPTVNAQAMMNGMAAFGDFLQELQKKGTRP